MQADIDGMILYKPPQGSGGAIRYTMWLSRTFNLPIYTLFPPADPINGWNDLDVRYFGKRRKLPIVGRRVGGDAIDRREYAFWRPPEEFDIVISSGLVTKATMHQRHQKRIHFTHGFHRGAFGVPPRNKFSDNTIMEILQKSNRISLRSKEEFGLKRADVIIADSEPMADTLEFYYDISVEEAINPPINIGKFTNKRPPVEDFYLFMAHLRPYKNVRQVVEAFNGLDQHLIIAGEGPLEDELKAIADDNIKFVGFIKGEQKHRLLGTCKGFIQNSEFGMSPMEALASGAPVLGIDHRENALIPAYPPDIIEDGKNGILYQQSDSVEPLREAVRRVKEINWDYDAISESIEHLKFESRKNEWERVLEEI